ncbi:MAG TPA: ABC transporter ATP-binding protein [Acidothermaceae bacterium]|nr:ABC transporter ATP-binding protein [Acidothermaceae bacterium]
MHAISVRGLRMNYGHVRAVDGINFDVGTGEIFALLGPNGAGKTTTIEILEGYRKRTGGEVTILGVDPERGGRRYRERIGIMLQAGGIDADMTVLDTVRLYAGFYRRPRPIDATIAMVGLDEHRKARIRTLSGGLQRRLDLCLALIGDPEIIFLDEPTTGFDPTARRAAWDMVANLRDLGKTVLLTSHYMDEVEHLADRVAVMRHGVIVAEATPHQLGGRDTAEALISFRTPYAGPGEIPAGPWTAVDNPDDIIELRTGQPTHALLLLTGWAIEHGIELESLTVTRPTLEEAYLSITARPEQAD